MKKKNMMVAALMVAATPVMAQPKLEQLEQEANALIDKMTLEEKFSQLMNETPGIPRLGIEPYDLSLIHI